MSDKPRYYCWQFDAVDCCSSCHNEWDDGYGEPFEDDGDEFIYCRCCSARTPTVDEIKAVSK